MNKIILFLVLFLSMLSFSSCFETVEEINLKDDGSGTMTLTLNASQSKAKIASLMKLKSVNGHRIPSQEEVKSEIAESARQISGIPGVSNVKQKADFQNFIITLSFDFQDVKQINLAMAKILKNYNIPLYNAAGYGYSKANKAFAKVFNLNRTTKDKYNQLKPEDKEALGTAQYTSVYRFESLVSDMSNQQVNLSGSKKAVMQKVGILDILNSKVNLNNVIRLK